MSDLTCVEEGCENTGVVPVDPPTDPPTYKCFAHMGIVVEEDGSVTVEPEPASFVPDIANNLGAELLEALSVSMAGDEVTIDGVFTMLAEMTGLDRTIMAAIMLALSMVATAGQVPSNDVLVLANTLRANAADAEWVDQDAPPLANEVSPVLAGLGSDESPEAGTDAASVCPTCDGNGVVFADADGATDVDCPMCAGTGYLPEPSGPADHDDDDEGTDDE